MGDFGSARERERERERRGVPNKNEERRSHLTDSWERYHDITAAPASLRRSRVAHTHPPGEDRNNPNISNAAIYSKNDPFFGVSERILTGKLVISGTSSFSLILDTS